MSHDEKNIAVKNLMVRVKDSDYEAYTTLFNLLWKPLYTRAYALSGDRQMSEDAVQEVWIDLWTRRKEIENEHIEGYLFRAVRFRIYNELRNANKRSMILKFLVSDAEEAHNNTEERICFEEAQMFISQAIEKLPAKCRQVFQLSRIEGKSNTEIAALLDISKKTVENHLHNALKILRNKRSSNLNEP